MSPLIALGLIVLTILIAYIYYTVEYITIKKAMDILERETRAANEFYSVPKLSNTLNGIYSPRDIESYRFHNLIQLSWMGFRQGDESNLLPIYGVKVGNCHIGRIDNIPREGWTNDYKNIDTHKVKYSFICTKRSKLMKIIKWQRKLDAVFDYDAEKARTNAFLTLRVRDPNALPKNPGKGRFLYFASDKKGKGYEDRQIEIPEHKKIIISDEAPWWIKDNNELIKIFDCSQDYYDENNKDK